MRLLRLLALGLAFIPLLCPPVTAQTVDPSFTAPTSLYSPGTVYSLGPQQADGARVVSGAFTRVNGTPVTSRVVRFDATGALDQAFLQNVGAASTVYRITGLANGQYLLSGSGSGPISAGGPTRTELLRLNADGTGDATFDAGGGPLASGGYAYTMAQAVQPDGKIVVVGYFDTFNMTPAFGVVRLNPDGTVDSSFSTGTGIGAGSYTNAVAVQPDGKILVGGSFTAFNNQAAYGLVRLNANGSRDTSFQPPLQAGSEVVGLVLQPDGNILANGYVITNSATGAQPGLIRMLPNGTVDMSFVVPSYLGDNITGYYDPAVVLQPDGKILVIGLFGSTPSVPNHVVRLNADGTADSSFQPIVGPGDTPNAIGLQANGSILLGGSFNSISGVETALGRIAASGAPDLAFAPTLQVNGSITALVRQADGKLVIGGNFTEINGQRVHRLARLNANGTPDAAFAAATGLLPGPVSSMVLQPDGKLVAGTSAGVVRFATTGSPDASFNGFTALPTTALVLQPDGKLILGGSFNGTSGSLPYNHLVRLTSTGAFDPSFTRDLAAPGGQGQLVTPDALLLQPDGRLVVGGMFLSSGIQSYTSRVIRYEATGTLDASFTMAAFTGVNGNGSNQIRVSALALQPDGKILAGGNFGAVNGSLQYGVARLATTGALDAGFAPNTVLTGTVSSLAQQPNGRILLGGVFSSFGASVTHVNLGRVLSNGQMDASFGGTATPNGIVRALLVQPDGAIVLAGNFTTVGGQPNVGVARITAANVLHVAAPAAVAGRTAAWPVPAHGRLHVAPDASAQPLSIELLDALGRAVRQQPATSAPEQTLTLDALPAGVYLLRVQYAVGTVTRRIAVQ